MVEIVTDQCLKTDVFVSKYCILMDKCRLRMYSYIQDKSINVSKLMYLSLNIVF